MRLLIFFSFCIMLLVSLLEIEIREDSNGSPSQLEQDWLLYCLLYHHHYETPANKRGQMLYWNLRSQTNLNTVISKLIYPLNSICKIAEIKVLLKGKIILHRSKMYIYVLTQSLRFCCLLLSHFSRVSDSV